MELDNLHFNSSSIDGAQRPICFAISGREDGKSTTAHLKAYDKFKKDKATTIVFKRLITDITPLSIDSFFDPIEKFRGVTLRPKFSKQDMTTGICPVFVDGAMMYLIVALAVPKTRYKSLFVKNPAFFLFDEFICDTRAGEKYLSNEVFRFKEAYSTFYREGSNVKCYFFGNPYSLYNPYFLEYGISPSELANKRLITGTNWVAQYHALSPDLVKAILAKNPLHKFDDDYFKYAIEGQAINDVNIRIMPTRPRNFSLSCIFYFEGRYYGLFRSNAYDYDLRYWIGHIDTPSKYRQTFCFDFKDLCAGSMLFNRSQRERFSGLISAMMARKVAFEDLSCDNAMEEIYRYL